jgi:hypothetical protein
LYKVPGIHGTDELVWTEVHIAKSFISEAGLDEIEVGINPSARSFKFRCRVSPAVIFSDCHLNFDRELIYSSLFLNYMRYKYETFTNMILKDGSIIVFII